MTTRQNKKQRGGWGDEGEGLMIGEMDEVLKKACAVCYCCLRRYKWQRSTGLEPRLNRTERRTVEEDKSAHGEFKRAETPPPESRLTQPSSSRYGPRPSSGGNNEMLAFWYLNRREETDELEDITATLQQRVF